MPQMNSNWIKFWTALAVMSVSLAAAVYAGLGQPWDLGSLADWVSGIATFAAVIVALKVAREQGQIAMRVASEDRTERAKAAENAEWRHVKYLIQIVSNAQLLLRSAYDPEKDSAPPTESFVTLWTKSSSNGHIDEALKAFPVFSLPNSQMMDMLFRSKTVIDSARGRLLILAMDPSEENKKEYENCIVSIGVLLSSMGSQAVRHGVRASSTDEYLVWQNLTAALVKK